ncbi:acyltransferase-domain-containing protein [Protomyces lactucae-debilis]|uniref:Acyltransferase-domain-containing protein n=1 Tax=Protomyces lactucae-debilis TaxID=2754530 RepID=A0A1Y2FRR1_PROLT|nr:acyltransferase-domain-containing protein [Protomyces lactucae-debilis]ORY86277.1 acyltransferase-domain-containing protein [Protomyces lactucae-debilis]
MAQAASPSFAYKLLRLLGFIAWFLSNCLIIHATQFLGLPFLFLSKHLWYAWIQRTKAAFGLVCVTLVQWFAPTRVVVSGDHSTAAEIQPGDIANRVKLSFAPRAVMISNHQIYADWLFMWWTAYTSNLHGAIYIILKESLKWIPVVGWGMQFFGFIFMARSWERDRPNLERTLQRLSREREEPLWLLLYPEGTNHSPNTRGIAQAYAKKVDGPELRRTLLPRTTGLRFCLQQLGETCPWVYDCTIAYEPLGETDFAAKEYTLRSMFFEGKPPQAVHMHWRKFAVSDIPLDDAGFQAWLFERWAEKEAMLDKFYKGQAGQRAFEDREKVVLCEMGLNSTFEVASIFVPIATAALLVNILLKVSRMVGVMG